MNRSPCCLVLSVIRENEVDIEYSQEISKKSDVVIFIFSYQGTPAPWPAITQDRIDDFIVFRAVVSVDLVNT